METTVTVVAVNRNQYHLNRYEGPVVSRFAVGILRTVDETPGLWTPRGDKVVHYCHICMTDAIGGRVC